MNVKELLVASLSAKPFTHYLQRRVARSGGIVLMYHELAGDRTDIEAWSVVRRSDFLRQMDYLRRGFDVLSLSEALIRMENSPNVDRPFAVITFDDGDMGNYEVLMPIVEEHEVPVTVFVATKHVADQTPYWFDDIVNALQTDRIVRIDLRDSHLAIYEINRNRGAANWAEIERLLSDLKILKPQDREQAVADVNGQLRLIRRRQGCRIAPMTVEDVRQLARSRFVTIGAHSHCHNILTQLDKREAAQSVVTSKRLLEQWTGSVVEYFAYPNGDHNDEVEDIVRHAGFHCALTTSSRLWRRGESVFRIPRIGVGRYDSSAEFRLNSVGGLKNLPILASWFELSGILRRRQRSGFSSQC